MEVYFNSPHMLSSRGQEQIYIYVGKIGLQRCRLVQNDTFLISICLNGYLTGPCGLFALCGLQFVTKPVLLLLVALLVVNVT